jgi:hypothetical protein
LYNIKEVVFLLFPEILKSNFWITENCSCLCFYYTQVFRKSHGTQNDFPSTEKNEPVELKKGTLLIVEWRLYGCKSTNKAHI